MTHTNYTVTSTFPVGHEQVITHSCVTVNWIILLFNKVTVFQIRKSNCLFLIFHLKLSQVPHFQKPVVTSRQDERLAPVPADHVDVWGVSLIGWEHWIGRGTDIPDANGLIHWTRCKYLVQSTHTDREIWTWLSTNKQNMTYGTPAGISCKFFFVRFLRKKDARRPRSW